MGVFRKVFGGFWEVLGDAGIALGVDVVLKQFAKAGAEKIVAKHEQIADQRAEILNDLRIMQPAEKANLLRRHKEATEACTENRLISLLLKIKPSEEDGRRITLKWLNDLDDDEFNQMLNVLEHDVIAQQVAKIVKEGGLALRILRSGLRRHAAELGEETASAWKHLDKSAELLAVRLRAQAQVVRGEKKWVKISPDGPEVLVDVPKRCWWIFKKRQPVN